MHTFLTGRGDMCGRVRAGAAARRRERPGWRDPRTGPGPQLVHAHLHHAHALRLHRPPQVIPPVAFPFPLNPGLATPQRGGCPCSGPATSAATGQHALNSCMQTSTTPQAFCA